MRRNAETASTEPRTNPRNRLFACNKNVKVIVLLKINAHKF